MFGAWIKIQMYVYATAVKNMSKDVASTLTVFDVPDLDSFSPSF